MAKSKTKPKPKPEDKGQDQDHDRRAGRSGGHFATITEPDGERRAVFFKGPPPAGMRRGGMPDSVRKHLEKRPGGAARAARYARMSGGHHLTGADQGQLAATRNLAAAKKRGARGQAQAKAKGGTLRERVEAHRKEKGLTPGQREAVAARMKWERGYEYGSLDHPRNIGGRHGHYEMTTRSNRLQEQNRDINDRIVSEGNRARQKAKARVESTQRGKLVLDQHGGKILTPKLEGGAVVGKVDQRAVERNDRYRKESQGGNYERNRAKLLLESNRPLDKGDKAFLRTHAQRADPETAKRIASTLKEYERIEKAKPLPTTAEVSRSMRTKKGARAKATTLRERVKTPPAKPAPTPLRDRTRTRLESAKATKALPPASRKAIAGQLREARGGGKAAAPAKSKAPTLRERIGDAQGKFKQGLAARKAAKAPAKPALREQADAHRAKKTLGDRFQRLQKRLDGSDLTRAVDMRRSDRLKAIRARPVDAVSDKQASYARDKRQKEADKAYETADATLRRAARLSKTNAVTGSRQDHVAALKAIRDKYRQAREVAHARSARDILDGNAGVGAASAPSVKDVHAHLERLHGGEVDDRGNSFEGLAKRMGVKPKNLTITLDRLKKEGAVEYDHMSPVDAMLARESGSFVHTDPDTGKPVAAWRVMRPEKLRHAAGRS